MIYATEGLCFIFDLSIEKETFYPLSEVSFPKAVRHDSIISEDNSNEINPSAKVFSNLVDIMIRHKVDS